MFRPFGYNDILLIMMGVQWTLVLSVIAVAGGAAGGLLVALGRVSERRALRFSMIALIRFFQGTPLLMQLFLVYFGLNVLGFGINPWVAACLALILHASAYFGEIWRGCIVAVPQGQSEASWALGLSYVDRMRFILLPQAARIAVAPTVGFLVQLIKGTSLASIIGFVELSRAGQLVSSATFQPFTAFGLVAVLYFIMCWPLSLLATSLERKFAIVSQR